MHLLYRITSVRLHLMISRNILSSPALIARVHDKPLILYATTLDGSFGALLAQNNDEGKENALYFLSRMLVGMKISYSSIGKHCLALIFTVKKLRHYMLEYKLNSFDFKSRST